MTNVAKIPRAYVALGLCLPLAVLLGYLVAEPLESSSLAVLVLVFSVLATPLLMKWYHPLLILSWNACVTPYFFPGQFSLWVLMAGIGFFFAILNRSVNPERRFTIVPSVTVPLMFLAAVVLVTALLTGGIGIRSLGGGKYGGSRYVYIYAAVAGYFALTSRRISPNRAGLYAAMFFLPGLTALIGNVAYTLGPSFYFLYYLFPAGNAMEQAIADYSIDQTILRIGGLAPAVAAVYGYLLSRYGFRGMLDFSKPLRIFLFIGTFAACVATGFRSALILFLLILAVLFYLEGLHRTRWVLIFGSLAIALALVVLPYAYRLPLPVQRTLSFLPAANVDSLAEANARASSEWRFAIWKEVLPDVPRYLLKGKGYSIDPADLDPISSSLDTVAGVKAAGDYHSGPLSVLIPLGAFGLFGFLWFLVASARVLYRYYRFGDPNLRAINGFLFASFIAKGFSFFFVFGSFYSDLFIFVGLIGVAISLNGVLRSDRSKAAESKLANTRPYDITRNRRSC